MRDWEQVCKKSPIHITSDLILAGCVWETRLPSSSLFCSYPPRVWYPRLYRGLSAGGYSMARYHLLIRCRELTSLRVSACVLPLY